MPAGWPETWLFCDGGLLREGEIWAIRCALVRIDRVILDLLCGVMAV